MIPEEIKQAIAAIMERYGLKEGDEALAYSFVLNTATEGSTAKPTTVRTARIDS